MQPQIKKITKSLISVLKTLYQDWLADRNNSRLLSSLMNLTGQQKNVVGLFPTTFSLYLEFNYSIYTG